MYLDSRSLIKDFKESKIGGKEVFFFANNLSNKERKKFINKARDLFLIKG